MIWLFLLVIFLAGSVGGIVNALLTDNGFFLPRKAKADRGDNILKPGFLGNVLIGGIASCISWGLYGPFANAYIVWKGSNPAPNLQTPGITVASLVGGLLVGVGGSRWLTNEVDKTLLRKTAIEAAAASKNDTLAEEISTSTPEAALMKAAKARNES